MTPRIAFPSLLLLVVATITTTTNAFVVAPQQQQLQQCKSTATTTTFLRSSEDAVFVPPTEEENKLLEETEMLGRGAAKTKRGKKKSGPSNDFVVQTKESVTLAPEEVFYEGPPAITETIGPTLSIITVLGIIPAAAAWARQAWVRYKITTRRIRVTSGVNGKDMAEIVYPDITELRTAKRLFGDGDLVVFLRDGARFEMRNIPNFDDAMEFILKQVDPDVVAAYKEKGMVN